MRQLAIAMLWCAAPGVAAAQVCRQAPWDSVAAVLQTNGADAGGACRFAWPRTDLRVRVSGVVIRPALALGSWAGFGALGADTLVLGDLVVTADELGPVLRQFAEDDVAVTAIHNHLVGESPRVMYVHFEGRGGALELAARVARAVARTGAPRPVRAVAEPVTIDTAVVFTELGARGRASGAVAQLSFNLAGGGVALHGHALPASLALGSPINVQAVSPRRVVATGDFTVPAARVDPVLDALARHGITATAVHSHLVGESPALYFIHFWADGETVPVLRALRAVLDAAR